MAKQTYDIFISYRRNGGAQFARILQLMLQQRGYNVFLDYDELTDGVFSDHIVAAIKEAPIFMMVLSEKALERCKNEDDWVRQEILLAMSEGKQIIPVNPDGQFDGIPEEVPEKIKIAAGAHQHSDISFGQTLGVTVDFMIEKRIAPVVGSRTQQSQVDTDYDTAKESLRKMESHQRFMKRLVVFGVALVVLIVLAGLGLFFHQQKEKAKKEAAEKARVELRMELERKYQNFQLRLDWNLTQEQMNTIDTILMNMKEVCRDSLWMSKFEFTVGQWYGVLGKEYDVSQKDMPMTEVSFGDVYSILLDTLRQFTGIDGFSLPDADEWEYAAHGGNYHETTRYAGSDNVDQVAWYQGNSGGVAHPSDGQQNKKCNHLDLFDMSGNVAEWCYTSQILDGGTVLWTVCGGHYNSPASEVTVSSRAGLNPAAKEKTVGFRLVIRNY